MFYKILLEICWITYVEGRSGRFSIVDFYNMHNITTDGRHSLAEYRLQDLGRKKAPKHDLLYLVQSLNVYGRQKSLCTCCDFIYIKKRVPINGNMLDALRQRVK